MQSTSAAWRALAQTGEARLETVAVIDGTEYAAISAPQISRALMQDGLSVGNAVSATCRLTVLTDDDIPRAASVAVRMRLADGTTASEWLPAGTFYVSHRERDAVTGLTTLDCYDAMLKANAAYDRDGAWPRSMAAVAGEIAQALGVTMDPRTVLQSGDDFRVLLPEAGATMRDVLSGIASAHGGNWALTPENRLRLVPLASADGAALANDAAQVRAVLGGVSAGTARTITGLRVTGVGEERLIGTDAGLVLKIDSPYVTDGSLTWLAGWLLGTRYQPFALRGAIYDPAAELGDYVRSRDDVASVLISESAALGLAFRGDIGAPEPGEIADEYPYIGTPDRLKQLSGQVQALEETKADSADVDAAEARADAAAQGYANAAAQALDAALTQTEIFNRLTNDGEAQGIYLRDGRLYLNGTYIDTGTLNANLIRAGTISDASGQNYWILAGNASEFVTRKGEIGNFAIEGGSLQIGSLDVGGNGAYIGNNGVIYNETFEDTGNTSKVRMYGQGLEFTWNGAEASKLFQSSTGVVLRCYLADGSYVHPIQLYNTDSTQGIHCRWNLRSEENFYANKNLTVINNAYVVKDLAVYGNFSVTGTKNRRMDAGQYGERLLYCYETPSPLFGDVGEGVIGDDGLCYVALDAVFAQTVLTARYQVFVQAYGAGDCHVCERRGDRFVVAGTPGLAFGWEIKARQADGDQRRLDAPREAEEAGARDYGGDALLHMEKLREGRIAA